MQSLALAPKHLQMHDHIRTGMYMHIDTQTLLALAVLNQNFPFNLDKRMRLSVCPFIHPFFWSNKNSKNEQEVAKGVSEWLLGKRLYKLITLEL